MVKGLNIMAPQDFDHLYSDWTNGKSHLSQKVTYLFCDELDIVSKELRSRVRQATKDVVKSEV